MRFFGCNMTWYWTRASIYSRSISKTILMSVITCQGGVTINNCYSCMLMFACTFYNGFSAKKSHSTANKSHFVSIEGERNLTIDFGNITFHMKWTNFCSYIFIILVFLHRNAEIIIDSYKVGRDLWRPFLPSPMTHWKEGRSSSDPSTDNTTKKLELNLSCKITILLKHFLLQCALPVAVWFHTEITGTDWNPLGKLTTLPGNRNLSWKLFLMHLKMQET